MIVGGLTLSDNLLYGKHIRTQTVLHAAPVYCRRTTAPLATTRIQREVAC